MTADVVLSESDHARSTHPPAAGAAHVCIGGEIECVPIQRRRGHLGALRASLTSGSRLAQQREGGLEPRNARADGVSARWS